MVGFVIVAFVSIIPETFISINSAIEGVPSFGLATLFGSNIADLTIVFALLIILAGRGIKIESKVLKNVKLLPFFIAFPLLFGLNGHYSRTEGIALIISGLVFYYLVFRSTKNSEEINYTKEGKTKNIFYFTLSILLLLVGAHFVVSSATHIANVLGINPILIGLLVVSLGTVIPEFFYSLKAVKKRDDSLAMGDILGAVLADTTIVVGILATINPFYFPIKVVYVTGLFMISASILLLDTMISNKKITKKEGYILLLFWVLYVVIEFVFNTTDLIT